MSTVFEDDDGCAKQYIFDLDSYLITVFSSSYGIIMHRTINAPVHKNNVVDGLNATYKLYLKAPYSPSDLLEPIFWNTIQTT